MARFLRASTMPKSISATRESVACLPRTVVPCKCFSRVLPVRAIASEASVSLEYHATLGVSFGASKLEIKRAYRRLAMQFHPDVCKDGCSEQWFKRINHAYESLMDRSCWASVAVPTTCCSEAGNRSLEDLLNSEMSDYETGWSIEEEASTNTFIDCSWLKVGDQQEIVDASIFITASEVEVQTDAEFAWFTGEFESRNCNLC